MARKMVKVPASRAAARKRKKQEARAAKARGK